MGLLQFERVDRTKSYPCRTLINDKETCGYVFRLTPPSTGKRTFFLACPSCGKHYEFAVTAHVESTKGLKPCGHESLLPSGPGKLRCVLCGEDQTPCRHVTLKPVGGGKFECAQCGERQ